MKHTLSALLLFAAPAALLAQDISAQVDGQLSSLVQTYKELHSHPELSHHEEQTSALVASELRKAGYTVTDHVGKYPDGSRAFGVVGILSSTVTLRPKNGLLWKNKIRIYVYKPNDDFVGSDEFELKVRYDKDDSTGENETLLHVSATVSP